MPWWSGILPGPADAFGLGLVLVLIGIFLLANGLLVRNPRTLLAEHFGAPRGRLVMLRSALFQRLQAHLAFLFLLVGFALQVYGHYRAGGEVEPARFPLRWVVALALSVAALELGGWWLSHALFLRILRTHFRAHPPALEADLPLARELGELFGIASDGNDSVSSYLARIRRRLGLDEPPREPVARRAPARQPTETEEGFV
ncbi:MAG TPA: hypothetical protein VF530_06755 [Planctomycetota bacterium]